jgi:hypothetical protein
MEKLSLEKHAAMISIFSAPRGVWLVRLPACKASVISALYSLGYIMTDRIYQGQILRFKITQEGENYGQQYCSGNTNTSAKQI